MDAAAALRAMGEVNDAHDWNGLAALLHPELVVSYVHTGERFDREQWVRLNEEYPGFESFQLQDVVADGDRAAGRAHVTAITDGETRHFECASFLTVTDGLIREIVEVWTDVNQPAPPGTR